MRKNAYYTTKSTHSLLWFQFNHHLSVSNYKRRDTVFVALYSMDHVGVDIRSWYWIQLK